MKKTNQSQDTKLNNVNLKVFLSLHSLLSSMYKGLPHSFQIPFAIQFCITHLVGRMEEISPVKIFLKSILMHERIKKIPQKYRKLAL